MDPEAVVVCLCLRWGAVARVVHREDWRQLLQRRVVNRRTAVRCPLRRRQRLCCVGSRQGTPIPIRCMADAYVYNVRFLFCTTGIRNNDVVVTDDGKKKVAKVTQG